MKANALLLALSMVWGMSLLVIGFDLWRGVSSLAGLSVTALGQYVLMDQVLDKLVRPVKTDVTGLLKLTAALVFLLAGACTLWPWWGML